MWRAMGRAVWAWRRADRIRRATGRLVGVPDPVVLWYAGQARRLVAADRPMLAFLASGVQVIGPLVWVGIVVGAWVTSPGTGGIGWGFFAMLGPAVAVVVVYWLHRRAVAERVKRLHLARRARLKTCAGCGYDVSHSAAERCSECGRPVRVRPDPGPVPGEDRRRNLVRAHLCRRAAADPILRAAVVRVGLIAGLIAAATAAAGVAAWLASRGLPGGVVAGSATAAGVAAGTAAVVVGGACAAWDAVRRRVTKLQAAGKPVCWFCGSDRSAGGPCSRCGAGGGDTAPEAG